MKVVTSVSLLVILAVFYFALLREAHSLILSLYKFKQLMNLPNGKVNSIKNTATFNEETYRFGIFIENLLRITLHNSKQMQNYQMGVNQFTDLT